MNKGLIIGLSSTAVLVGGIIAYRYFVPPYFKITEYAPETNSGEFVFGNTRNMFGNSNGTIQGRFDWTLDIIKQPDGTTKFDLFKDRKFIRTIAIK